MTQRPWTPGPWKSSAAYGNKSEPISFDVKPADSGWESIATCWHGHERDPDHRIDRRQMEANAHLIAAAPDLYEALEALLNDDGPEKLRSKHWNMARNALAKARGEAK